MQEENSTLPTFFRCLGKHSWVNSLVSRMLYALGSMHAEPMDAELPLGRSLLRAWPHAWGAQRRMKLRVDSYLVPNV